MGERVTVTRFDDFDNEIGADEAITYALDGTTYEIDLLDGNARRLLSELEKWIRVSRRVSGSDGRSRAVRVGNCGGGPAMPLSEIRT